MSYSTRATVIQTYDLAKQASGIYGCFVECGVGAGAQLMAMALANRNKDIIGFDSFEGIPLSGPHDDQQPGIGKPEHDVNLPISERLVSSNVTSHSIENIKQNFVQAGIGMANVKLIRGWFQNTLPKFKNTPIALLRLDGDLYESTLCCLEHLYPMVTVGGIVIIDDYALPGCRKAVYDYFGENMPEMVGEGVVYFYKK